MTKAIKEWKTPTKIKEVESFLEFANFYQKFIQNFIHTAKSLNELKDKKNRNRRKSIKNHLMN